VADQPESQLDPKTHRRLLVGVLLRAIATVTVLVVLYYVLPVNEGWHLSGGLRLVVGLILFIVVISWQVKSVASAEYPGIRAIGALALILPLFLLSFAATYFLMSSADAGNFSQEGLTRTDSLYYAVTIFSTVGFGDIYATSQSARVVVTCQMILNLLILGLGVRAFVSAVQLGQKRSDAAGGRVGPS
jgi:hypothetical protein